MNVLLPSGRAELRFLSVELCQRVRELQCKQRVRPAATYHYKRRFRAVADLCGLGLSDLVCFIFRASGFNLFAL